jgi:hypothetical protein
MVGYAVGFSHCSHVDLTGAFLANIFMEGQEACQSLQHRLKDECQITKNRLLDTQFFQGAD